MTKVISIANQKGGVGKTTCSINLGGALAERGYRVLCMDMDPQANLTVGLGISLSDVHASMADVLSDDLPSTDVLVANIELAIVERLLARARARFAVTSGYLEAETPSAPAWTHAVRLELEGWAADVFAGPH